ncbi:MAG: RraA family protein [Clostridiaceae bacterium]|nr:RraA family protein [Clostridiaceae bacterium]
MWSEELKERFLNTDPATYGHYLGVRFMLPKMKPLSKTSKMVGPAYTVKMMGKDSYALYKALEEAPKGSVIVIDRCGDEVYACVGEMVARNAKALGMAGIVIDGTATDSVWIEKMDFPVFCTGISVVTTNVWGITGETQIDVSCCGAAVHPGDIVFGDADGVVVLPPEGFEDMLSKAEDAAVREVAMRRQFEEGTVHLKTIKPLTEADMAGIIYDIRMGIMEPPKKKKQ